MSRHPLLDEAVVDLVEAETETAAKVGAKNAAKTKIIKANPFISQASTLEDIQSNLDHLTDLHKRLQFMISEIEELLKY